MRQKLVLPKELEKYREELKKTERDVLVATLMEEKPVITDSKIGGTPYYPHGTEYPLDKEGEPMLLLAQINFSELPKNDKFPNQGILQFFIPKNDEMFGWDEGSEDDDMKIIFHKNVRPELNQNTPIPWQNNYEDEEVHFPVSKEAKILFSKTSEYLNGHVYYYSDIVVDDVIDDDIDEPDSHYATKLLGYPGFTQYDPREVGEAREILLFQLSSDNENVFIGDYGIMNFFISPEDLKELDFSNVLYNWDCY